MSKEKIPCSVEILTRNSEATLEKCLESVKGFAEIIILDGNSTDRTLEIARRYGCRIYKQFDTDEPLVKINDFSEVRNKGLRLASFNWFMYIDADEYLLTEAVEEIKQVVNDPHSQIRVWWQPRKYVLDGKIIDCATTYPNQQIRFFHKDWVGKFIKPIHERIEIEPGVKTGRLKNFECVPMGSFESLRARWDRYLELEGNSFNGLGRKKLLLLIFRQAALLGLYVFRYFRGLFFCQGARLPLRYELARHKYTLRLVFVLLGKFKKYFLTRVYLQNLILLFLGTILGLFLVEVGLRLLPKSSNDVLRYDPVLRRKYLANLDTYISSEGDNKAVRFKTNSLGFVGPEYKKEKSGFRIINLGDSFTAGWGVDFDKNFSTLLAPMLTEKTGLKVESLNFGIGGQGTMNSVATYRQYGKQFTPDLVLLWFYLGNDFRDNLLYKEKETQALWQRAANRSELLYFVVTRIQRNPRLLSIVSMVRGRIGISGDVESGIKSVPGDLAVMQSNISISENKRSAEMTKKYLGFLRTAVEGDGSKLLVVVLPANFQVDKRLERTYLREYPVLNTTQVDFNAIRSEHKLLEILDELGLEYLDLVPFMKERCKIDCNFYLVAGGHFSQKGHIFVASSTVDFVTQKGLIK